MTRKDELKVLISYQRKHIQKISDEVGDTIEPHDLSGINTLKKEVNTLEGQIKEYVKLMSS